MATQPDNDPQDLNTRALAAAVHQAELQTRQLLDTWLQRPGAAPANADPLNISNSFQQFAVQLARNPLPLWEAQWKAWQNTLGNVQNLVGRSFGREDAQPNATPADRRFKDPEWNSNPLFEFIRQTYLLCANSLLQLSTHTEGLAPHDAHKVAFYTRQFVDAISPTNFALTNPEVIRATLEQGGTNLVDGLRNFCQDIDPATGQLRTRMVDTTAFELGKNVATTPGSVVFQNDLMQLLQFSPTTRTVARRPLLIVPPWINKYYVLDLQPGNSFIRWSVDQGHTVFVISWVNPDASMRGKDFADYMKEGPLAALAAIEAATGERNVNAIGYCLGGTLLGATLAYLKQKKDTRIRTATFFAAMLDFSEPGDLGVFIDEAQISKLEEAMNERGYLDGKEMAATFNLMRASDLIWSFVVNNYLLGKSPAPFDLLYWNSDSTRMPAKMHGTYLRNMYLQNLLCEPGGMEIDDTPLDLRDIDVPTCFISTLEDHIAPWKSTYLGARLMSGPVKFILGKAGHIAGIVNPPGPRQYGHYTGPAPASTDADGWFAAAAYHPESWWDTWQAWLAAESGGEIPARRPGEGKLPRLEAAPGSYVRVRLD